MDAPWFSGPDTRDWPSVREPDDRACPYCTDVDEHSQGCPLYVETDVDFQDRAGYEFRGYPCQWCEYDIEVSDAIYYDVDGGHGEDGRRTVVRVWHRECWTEETRMLR